MENEESESRVDRVRSRLAIEVNIATKQLRINEDTIFLLNPSHAIVRTDISRPEGYVGISIEYRMTDKGEKSRYIRCQEDFEEIDKLIKRRNYENLKYCIFDTNPGERKAPFILLSFPRDTRASVRFLQESF